MNNEEKDETSWEKCCKVFLMFFCCPCFSIYYLILFTWERIIKTTFKFLSKLLIKVFENVLKCLKKICTIIANFFTCFGKCICRIVDLFCKFFSRIADTILNCLSCIWSKIITPPIRFLYFKCIIPFLKGIKFLLVELYLLLEYLIKSLYNYCIVPFFKAIKFCFIQIYNFVEWLLTSLYKCVEFCVVNVFLFSRFLMKSFYNFFIVPCFRAIECISRIICLVLTFHWNVIVLVYKKIEFCILSIFSCIVSTIASFCTKILIPSLKFFSEIICVVLTFHWDVIVSIFSCIVSTIESFCTKILIPSLKCISEIICVVLTFHWDVILESLECICRNLKFCLSKIWRMLCKSLALFEIVVIQFFIIIMLTLKWVWKKMIIYPLRLFLSFWIKALRFIAKTAIEFGKLIFKYCCLPYFLCLKWIYFNIVKPFFIFLYRVTILPLWMTIKFLAQTLWKATKLFYNFIGYVLSKIWQFISKVANIFWKLVTSFSKLIWRIITSTCHLFQRIIRYLSKKIWQLLTYIGNIFERVGRFFKNTFTRFGKFMKNLFLGVWRSFKSLISCCFSEPPPARQNKIRIQELLEVREKRSQSTIVGTGGSKDFLVIDLENKGLAIDIENKG